MRVFVAGATGVIGRPLVRTLASAGHQVVGMTRSAERAEAIAGSGVRGVVCDVFDRDALFGAIREARPDVVVHQLTDIPGKIDPRRIEEQFAGTNRLRREGTRNLLEAARAAGARIFAGQSVAFAYAPGPSGLRTEDHPLYRDAPPAFSEVIDSVASLEEQIHQAQMLTGIVLRYGFFYGPGTAYAPDGSFRQEVSKRRVPIVGDGAGTFSFIHVDDAAEATLRAIERGEGGIYNVVDDDPASVEEWLPEYAAIVGAKPPMRVPLFLGRLVGGPYAAHMMTAMAGASNRKARNELGWEPRHRSWREGFRSPRS